MRGHPTVGRVNATRPESPPGGLGGHVVMCLMKRLQAETGGGRWKRANATSEERVPWSAVRRTGADAAIGAVSNRFAARLATRLPCVAGSCPHPSGHIGDEDHAGPSS